MNLSARSSRPLVVSAVAISLATALIVGSWNGSFSGSSALSALTVGLSIGALYALYAGGLVVVYTTTGIFNFAQAAVGTLAAFCYWQLHVDWGWPVVPSLVLVVLIGAPILGLVLDALIMQRIRTAPLVTQLMVTVGLMIFILALVGKLWPQNESRSVDSFFAGEGWSLGDTRITWHRTIVLITALAIVFGLRLLHRSQLGLAMRAVVASPELASLNGVPPRLVTGMAWSIGCSLAAIAGILLAPSLQMTPINFNTILLWAIAAATFGRLQSLPIAFLGAIVLGIGQQFVRQFLSLSTDWPLAAESLSALAIFVVVLALPASSINTPPATARPDHFRKVPGISETAGAGIAMVIAAVALTGGWLHFGLWDPGAWNQSALNTTAGALASAVIGISLVPLTGWLGEVNLAPLAFGGFGAFLYLQFPSHASGNVLWLVPIALLTGVLGMVIAWPFARLSGIYLALGSMAFAHGMATLFFPHSAVFPIERATNVASIDLGFIRLDDRRAFVISLVVLLALLTVGLTWLRTSPLGRRWVAVNDSAAASATLGVGVVEAKVLAYGLSAAIAGVGGALTIVATQSADGVRQFELLGGLSIVLMIAVAGIGYSSAWTFVLFVPLSGAIVRRLEQTEAVSELVTAQEWIGHLGVGLAALGLALHQRGALADIGQWLGHRLPWRASAEREPAADDLLVERSLGRPLSPADLRLVRQRLGLDDAEAGTP